MFRRLPDLLPFLGALLLTFAYGYLLGRLITKRYAIPATPFIQRDLSRPSVPTVRLDGVYNGQLKGTVIGGSRLFLGSTAVIPDASGSFLIPAGTLLTNHVEIVVPAGMQFVASKRGKKYYPVDSASAAGLAPANRIYFRTAQEAEAAGYGK